MKKALMAGCFVFLGCILFVSTVEACHPWFNVNKYTVKVDDPVRFHIAYGHRYPFGHSFYNDDYVDTLYMLGPGDVKEEPGPRALGGGKYSPVQFESKKEVKEGNYLLVMESKGNFGAYTEKGYKRKSKKELKNEKITGSVRYSQNFCKAVVNAGENPSGDNYAKILGHGLEIVPLKNPGKLRTNDILPLKILHNGTLIGESVMVYATYMGFSDEPDAFAYTAWASKHNEGIAKIRLSQPGIWMIFVSHKFSYPDSELADQYSYQATLTFEVRP